MSHVLASLARNRRTIFLGANVRRAHDLVSFVARCATSEMEYRAMNRKIARKRQARSCTMPTQSIIEPPSRLIHLHPPTGKGNPINHFFPSGNKGNNVCFSAGLHATSFLITGVNRIAQVNELVGGAKNHSHIGLLLLRLAR